MIDDAPFYPLLGFTAAVMDGAVVLRLEFARSLDDYGAGLGHIQQFIMMPDAAASIGKALLERVALSGQPIH